jgi:hypothetical protein
MPMKALTIHQPNAKAILYYGKDIENRSRCMSIRGTIAVHAGAQVDNSVYLPKSFKKQIVKSAIIGIVDVLDCVDDHDSEWFNGPYGYVLDNPRPLMNPIPCQGQLGFWNVPPEIEKEMRKQLRGKKYPAMAL